MWHAPLLGVLSPRDDPTPWAICGLSELPYGAGMFPATAGSSLPTSSVGRPHLLTVHLQVLRKHLSRQRRLQEQGPGCTHAPKPRTTLLSRSRTIFSLQCCHLALPQPPLPGGEEREGGVTVTCLSVLWLL